MSGPTVSIVEHAAATDTRDVHAGKIINAIKSGRWEKPVKQIRRVYTTTLLRIGDRKAAKLAVDLFKKNLAAILWSGRFSRRANDSLIGHSGLLCADIDDLASGAILAGVRAKLLTSPYLMALFLSPTGRGLKAIFNAPADAQRHLGSFRAIERHVLEFTGAQIDESCKDVARLCFISYDPELFYNPNATEIEPLLEPEKPKSNFFNGISPDLSARQRIACELLGAIDWQSETTGYFACLGIEKHTSINGRRDCRVSLDNAPVPTVHCVHNSCHDLIETYNYRLRSLIAKAEYTSLDNTKRKIAAETIREARNRKSESTEPTTTTQAQPFPLHCLPPACEAIARAVCETVRVLESLPGCCTLGFLSAAIGASLQVRSGANRVTRGNLYILCSAESGSGKSETFRHLASPFLEFEAERVATWKSEMKPGLLAEYKILDAEIGRLTKSVGNASGSTEREEIRAELKEKLAALDCVEAKLRPPGLSCEDVTGEKLAVLLANNGEQLASLSADALAVVNILLGRYNKLDRTDEGIYLKAFTGDRCKVDRQSRESVLVESPCLSALWLTQPDKLDSLLGERSLTDGGLIPRILCCHTHCEAREIVEDAPEIPASVLHDYANLIRDLIETYRLADESLKIEPTAEALEAMNAHHNGIVRRRRVDLRDVTIYAARWNEQAWRIAVCLHAGLHGAQAHEYKLEIDTARRAIELADWFATQQLEILYASREKARREIWNEVLSLLADKPEGIRASDVYRARIVRNADEAHALLAAMEAGGELSGRDEQPESGGHVTRIFTRVPK